MSTAPPNAHEPAGAARNIGGSWAVRRRIIFSFLILCAAQLVYLTIWGEDSRLNETLALGAYALIGSMIGAYVFGAVWEDTSLKRTENTPFYGGGYGGGHYAAPPIDPRPT